MTGVCQFWAARVTSNSVHFMLNLDWSDRHGVPKNPFVPLRTEPANLNHETEVLRGIKRNGQAK